MLVRRDRRAVDGAARADLPRLAAARRRRRPGPATADRRRPRLPPDDPVPAGPAARAPRGPVPRRPARAAGGPCRRGRRRAARGRRGGRPGAGRVRADRGPLAGRGAGRGWPIPSCAAPPREVLLIGAAALAGTARHQLPGRAGRRLPRTVDRPGPMSRRRSARRIDRADHASTDDSRHRGMSRHDRTTPSSMTADAADRRPTERSAPELPRARQDRDQRRIVDD